MVASVEAFTDAANGARRRGRQDPGRLLRAAEGDGRRRRADGPGRPREPAADLGDRPRGAAGRRHRRRARREHRLLQGAVRTRRSTNTDALGLPDYANGNPEGYLFPATYTVTPTDKPLDVLKAMVDRWRQAADDARPRAGAPRTLGYTPGELMTIASLVEAEATRRRHAQGRPGDLQPAGDRGRADLRQARDRRDRQLRARAQPRRRDSARRTSPSTRRTTPARTPACRPARSRRRATRRSRPPRTRPTGDWFFYVTTNLKTGETKFAEDYDEFLESRRELQEYCQTSDAC